AGRPAQLARGTAGAGPQSANPHRVTAVQPDPGAQDRTEPSELLGPVLGVALGRNLCSGRPGPRLLSPAAIPRAGRSLTAFATRIAEACGVGGETVGDAERALGVRVLAVGGNTAIARDTVLASRTELLLYGDVSGLQRSAPRRPTIRSHKLV